MRTERKPGIHVENYEVHEEGIPPREFEILRVLLANAGRLVLTLADASHSARKRLRNVMHIMRKAIGVRQCHMHVSTLSLEFLIAAGRRKLHWWIAPAARHAR